MLISIEKAAFEIFIPTHFIYFPLTYLFLEKEEPRIHSLKTRSKDRILEQGESRLYPRRPAGETP